MTSQINSAEMRRLIRLIEDSQAVPQGNAPQNGWILYHGSNSPTITGPLRVNERDPGWFGQGFYLTASTEYAKLWGNYIHEFAAPTNIKYAHVTVVGNYQKIIYDGDAESANEAAGGTEGWIEDEAKWASLFNASLRQKGYGGIRVDFDHGKDTEVVVFDASLVRYVGLANAGGAPAGNVAAGGNVAAAA